MITSLQDPARPVPNTIVGLLLMNGWEVTYNATNDPYIHHVTGQYQTFSTWWDCLAAVIEFASNPE